MTEHATAAAGKTPAPARPGPAPLGSKQAHREATERDKRARRFLLRLSLVNWGIAVVAWTISAFLGITSPASILIYSVLFVIGLFAVVMALLTYLLEKFAHRPPDYEHANLEADGDEGGPAATGSVAAATAAAAAKTDAPAAKDAAPAAAAKDAAPAAPARPPKEAAPAAAAKDAAPAAAAKDAAPAAPAQAPKEAAPAAPAQAPKDAAPSADAGSKAPPAKGDAPAAPAKGDAPDAPADGKAAKGDAPAPPAG